MPRLKVNNSVFYREPAISQEEISYPDGLRKGDWKQEDFIKHLNPNSLIKKNGFIEPYGASLKSGQRVQFQRKGYFIAEKTKQDGKRVFNKTTGLRDSFKQKKKA